MGFVLAILVGLFGERAFRTRLFAGGYPLGVAFWGFGVFGGLIVLGIAGRYVAHVLQGDESSGAGWTLAALRGVAVPVALYALVTFVGVWRSAADSSFWVKIIARYFSIFLLSTAGACVMLGWFNMLVAAGVYWLKRRYLPSRATTVTN